MVAFAEAAAGFKGINPRTGGEAQLFRYGKRIDQTSTKNTLSGKSLFVESIDLGQLRYGMSHPAGRTPSG